MMDRRAAPTHGSRGVDGQADRRLSPSSGPRPRRHRVARWLAGMALPWLAFAFVIAFGWSRVALAGPPRDCESPRNAIDSVFAWQQPDTFDIKAATMCLDDAGRTDDELEEIARIIKAVFDERGLFIKMEAIPGDPGWRDPKSAKDVWIVDRSLPEVYVVRQSDGTWKWPPEVLRAVEELHQHKVVGSLAAQMPAWLRGKVLSIEIWQYLALTLVFVVGLVVRTILQLAVRARLQAVSGRFSRPWVEAVVEVVASPGATLVMGFMLWVTYPQLGLPLRAAIVVAVAVRIFIITSVVWAFYGLVDVLTAQMAEKAALTETKLDDQLVPLLRKSMKIVVVLAGVLFGLQNLDVDVGSLLAGLGIGGIAFALAAKDTVSNFLGSVMIFVDRPFQIGDWVAVDEAEGVVDEVGFRTTRLRGFEDALLVVPNSRFIEQKITNYGTGRYRRFKTSLGVTYSTPPERIEAFCEGIRSIIRAHPATRAGTEDVWFGNYGPHSLDVIVHLFFDVKTWAEELTARQEVLIDILKLAAALGIDFAFPTQTLHVETVRVGDGPPGPGEPQRLSREELESLVASFRPGRPARPDRGGQSQDPAAAPSSK